ncbi:phage major capsid protein [Methylocystis sp. L43]|jgi:HK97 family phage major capsid protein|uniref:phage major capsid protein n=1 Tax=unclassified Methylocystis TaxID=2625913 RepID=UPI0018C3346A|nr:MULTISPECIES: phage major capsid protein [unclassified Methylocystis]MBG0796245.1 phage major capsid protein [Methylocystis sp. L43]MBG0804167.1 phage major capsid protein [Methylocystis sp. H15]
MSAVETKTAGDDILADLNRAFSAFKETNDERLTQLEGRLGADVVTEEKLARIDHALDDTKSRLDRLALEMSRPRIGGKLVDDHSGREHKSAFNHYMRSGEASGLKALEAKALSRGSGADGGYLVPLPTEREVLRRLAKFSPIRAISSVREISGASLRRAYSTTGPAAGWVAEADPRPQTNNQQLADMTFPAMELYAMPAATQALLDDAVVDIEQWIAEEVQTAFAEQEGAAFVSGDGVNKPKGFLSYTSVADASWTWGNIGYVATGAAGAFAASDPSDALVNLVYALRAGFRQNGKFVMGRRAQSLVRQFKTTTGDYIWAPPATADAGASLMNFPVIEAEDMPDPAANSLSIAFGDFERGYVVVDRVGIRVLRDPYSAKPYVLFYTTKRVGGGVQNFEAIKLLKFAAS